MEALDFEVFLHKNKLFSKKVSFSTKVNHVHENNQFFALSI